MTALRKIVDSSALRGVFDLPPDFMNKKIEVVLFPFEEQTAISPAPTNDFPRFTKAQIEEWAKAPDIQALAGALKGANLPPDITMSDIRNQRLAEKYGI